MASIRIKISQLYPVGLELFEDSESFLDDLTPAEIENIVGAEATVILSDADVYTLVIDTGLINQVKTPVIKSKNTVSVGVGLETYSVIPVSK